MFESLASQPATTQRPLDVYSDLICGVLVREAARATTFNDALGAAKAINHVRAMQESISEEIAHEDAIRCRVAH